MKSNLPPDFNLSHLPVILNPQNKLVCDYSFTLPQHAYAASSLKIIPQSLFPTTFFLLDVCHFPMDVFQN